MPFNFLFIHERMRCESLPTTLLEEDIRQHFYLTDTDRRCLLLLRGRLIRWALPRTEQWGTGTRAIF